MNEKSYHNVHSISLTFLSQEAYSLVINESITIFIHFLQTVIHALYLFLKHTILLTREIKSTTT